MSDIFDDLANDGISIPPGTASVTATDNAVNVNGEWQNVTEYNFWDSQGQNIGTEYGSQSVWDNYLPPIEESGAWGGTGSTGGSSSSYDPLVLDLDGDGVDLVNIQDSDAYFNLADDNFAINTSWVSSDDGFLARDTNGDGVINDINELFGNATTSGFDELATLDSNNNGVIDSNDSAYSELLVWQDSNGDGVTQDGELTSLSDTGVASISLTYESTDEEFDLDGRVARTGTFIWADGSEGTVGDVEFAVDATFSDYVGNYAFYSEVMAVANIEGYGTMPDLHTAMSLDEGFRSFTLDLLAEGDLNKLVANFESLLVQWANLEDVTLEDIDPDGELAVNEDTGLIEYASGDSFSVTELAIIKAYYGETALNLTDSFSEERPGQANSYGVFYSEVLNEINRNLLIKFAVANGLLTDVLPSVAYNAEQDVLTSEASINELSNELFANMADTLTEGRRTDTATINEQALAAIAIIEMDPSLQPELGQALYEALDEIHGGNAMQLNSALSNELFQLIGIGGNGDDDLFGNRSDDVLLGGEGGDSIRANLGDDLVYGGAGADELQGEDGDDILNGGDGDDMLVGGNGNDELNGGQGDDTLIGDLELVALDSAVPGLLPEIEVIDGNEAPPETSFDDVLVGGDGGDTLIGGMGDDFLIGGNGGDTYVFTRNSGQDVIQEEAENRGRRENLFSQDLDVIKFENGAQIEDLWFEQQGEDLLVSIVGTEDSVLVEDWYENRRPVIDEFQLGEYATLDGGNVDQLVQAMAAFNAESGGDGELDQTSQGEINTAIAAAWEVAA